ncbi:Growth-regulating factor 4 [Rhynchospora pubera]|uniref:Growth-regulating factor n=1 Tax=Rhynchospora pubera TaxID=906938 RepID=A0AAV8BT56_9POAL|nr:Growth-regulating factor 4 [Rhynchospora pubera]KAJ4811474.1 Growth-regulating factor 4 [Rhynchospora pubera]
MAKPLASLSPAGDLTFLRVPESDMNRWRGAPFTAAQWQELETQALIFKYFVAGVPVPPDLLMAVRTSFEAMAAARYYHHSLGYGAYFGKKVDPEPGRCRRTDGKKWRCAKEAAPDSKYCERHMHRGRNRSRKPVESQHSLPVSVSVSQPPSPPANSTITSSLPSPGSGNGIGMGIGNRIEIGIGNSNGNGNGTYARSLSGGNGSSFGSGSASQLQIDPASYSRYPYGVVRATAADEQRLFSEASGTLRGLSSLDNSTTWRMAQSPYSLNASTGTRDPTSPLETGTYLPQAILTSDYTGGVMGTAKPESCGAQAHTPLHPFLDEWPRSGRNLSCWPDLGDGNSNSNSNRNSFSSTQLSISIPMASSDFSTPSSCSPDDMPKSEDL